MSKGKEIARMRCVDFQEEVDKLLKKNHKEQTYVDKRKVAYSVASGPAPRFYTTVDTAIRRVNEIEAGTFTLSNPKEIEMFHEINKRYQEKLKEYAGRKYRVDIMHEVITGPAPSFYITPSYAYRLMYEKEDKK